MIVETEEERLRIEEEVKTIKPYDMFSIDYGAFLIGVKYCYEGAPNCKQCPLTQFVLKTSNLEHIGIIK